MNIFIDTNVIIATLLQKGIVRRLVLSRPNVFLTPDACVEEVQEHREDLLRRGVPDADLGRALDLLTVGFVTVVSKTVYRDWESEAKGLIRDPDDVPVVAPALAVENEGIWTFDVKDFRTPVLTARIRVLTTADVSTILAGL